ncbi:MAG: hypothetical protein OXU36_18875 [Candidatus Poribacteria bacterium]|nr:hypothetical protein [Candidatus Poribacteria bacterium]
MRRAYTSIKILRAIPYFILGIGLSPLMIALSGCSETSSGGSGLTDVGRDEPTIVDSVLAIDVFEDRPDGITTDFFADANDRVYLWILWANVAKQHTVEVSWFSPDDDLEDPPFWNEKQTLTSTTGDKITWFYIDLPDDTGEWFVEIYLDDLFERSHVFWVE